MHPIFGNRTTFAAYVTVWVALAISLSDLLKITAPMSWRNAFLLSGTLCLLLAFMCLSPLYTCRSLPVATTKRWRLGFNHAGAAILVSALWVACARAIESLLGVQTGPEMSILVLMSLLLYFLSIALHYMFIAVQASRQSEILTRDAELRALKAQINPHFLFNSLNSIAALAVSDGPRAREMCIRLSDFLRNTLGLGERESVAWKDELELVRAYLDVEKVRFGARLSVEMKVCNECSDCRVPPLVLQPLIENAVKHGIATLVDGGTIRVEGEVREGLLRVLVENHFDPDSPTPRRHGLGLRNVRNRLQTRFGTAASLMARAEENVFKAEMVMPCQRSE
jgi:two-component system, LytTR family, sensor histidine kinase AlgZ